MTFRRSVRSMVRGFTVVLAAASLAGCASVTLVSDYDDRIDQGLTSLHEDTSEFVATMIAAAGTPAGTYAQNKDFYVKQDAKIDTLIVRAQAHQALGACPGPKVVAKALAASRSQVRASGLAQAEIDNAISALDTVKTDDCEIGLLRLIRANMDQLEILHKAQEPKGIPASARGPILEGGLGSTIRSAMTVEIAKKAAGKGDK